MENTHSEPLLYKQCDNPVSLIFPVSAVVLEIYLLYSMKTESCDPPVTLRVLEFSLTIPTSYPHGNQCAILKYSEISSSALPNRQRI
jgi:hypothetical protein